MVEQKDMKVISALNVCQFPALAVTQGQRFCCLEDSARKRQCWEKSGMVTLIPAARTNL